MRSLLSDLIRSCLPKNEYEPKFKSALPYVPYPTNMFVKCASLSLNYHERRLTPTEKKIIMAAVVAAARTV